VTPEDLVAEAEIGGTDVDIDDDSEPTQKAPLGADKKAGQAVSGGAEAKASDDLILQKAIEIVQKKS
jgi:hypothetical protein